MYNYHKNREIRRIEYFLGKKRYFQGKFSHFYLFSAQNYAYVIEKRYIYYLFYEYISDQIKPLQLTFQLHPFSDSLYTPHYIPL